MTKDQAHALLDGARHGVEVPAKVITLALYTTGDLVRKQPNQLLEAIQPGSLAAVWRRK